MNPPGSRFCNYCGNDLHFTIQPDGLLAEGSELRGTYVIENVIGEGGMGVVYRCHHKTLGTPYALKVLDPKLARMDIIRQRFLAEAKIQATVLHPHIVHVHDVIDRDKDGGPGVLAIVMDYIEGEALDQKIENAPLSVKDAVSVTLVVLDAIGFAHHANIVHRDLKPSNIMISSAEAREALYCGVKVMDFGIAKLLQENKQRTVTGVHMGTLRYMAPEQIENARDVDERSDLYSIGIMLYELLCGRTPFEEFREFELIQAHMSMKPPSMRNFRTDISDRLEAIVMKALEKDRANRYPNAEAFQSALLSLGGYDDIKLMLKPNEGATAIQTNLKLQRKIERAIAKNNEARGSEATGKGTRRANPKRSAVLTGVVADAPKSVKSVDAVKPVDAAKSVDTAKSADTAKSTDTAKSADTPRPVTKSASRRGGSAPGTPSRSFHRVRPVTLSDKASASDLAALATADTDDSELTQKRQRRTSAPRESAKKLDPVPARAAQAAPKPRSSATLKIVLLLLVLLVAAGLVYRYTRAKEATQSAQTPVAVADAAEKPAAQKPAPNIADAPASFVDTETGRMTVVPAARHWISTEKSDELHQVELPAFAIDQVETSYFQYAKCVEAGKCPPLARVPDDLNMPVTGLGFGSADAFCRFAGKELPTAEQWEAAARFGGEDNGITNVDVTCTNIRFGTRKNGECRQKTPAPESVFLRVQSGNPGHILNMLGNVREWTATADPQDPQKRLTKGGSYLSDRAEVNIGAALAVSANAGAEDVGFRCIRTM